MEGVRVEMLFGFELMVVGDELNYLVLLISRT